MSKPVYTIHAERDGAWWALDVPELNGVHSQSKRLDQARSVIEDVIDLMLDQAPGTYDLEVVIDDEDIRTLVHVATESRAVVERLGQQAREMQSEVVARLRQRGLPMRDIGELLGVSHQRVAQLERQDQIDEEAAAEAREAMVNQLAAFLHATIALDRRAAPERTLALKQREVLDRVIFRTGKVTGTDTISASGGDLVIRDRPGRIRKREAMSPASGVPADAVKRPRRAQ